MSSDRKNFLGDRVIITIDGPAGSGKSTVAKALAKRLQCSYLDTGAMYRALTLKALRQKIDLKSEQQLTSLADQTLIDLKDQESQPCVVLLDGEDVSSEIRSPEVTQHSFYISRSPGIRRIMVERQREIGKKQHLVLEGRDTGTVVFPQATKKFYLEADVSKRTERRLKDLKQQGRDIDPDDLRAELDQRDQNDTDRPVSPLKKAEDAIVIDSTELTVDEVVEKMMKYLKER